MRTRFIWHGCPYRINLDKEKTFNFHVWPWIYGHKFTSWKALIYRKFHGYNTLTFWVSTTLTGLLPDRHNNGWTDQWTDRQEQIYMLQPLNWWEWKNAISYNLCYNETFCNSVVHVHHPDTADRRLGDARLPTFTNSLSFQH